VTGVHWQPVIDAMAQGISGKNLTMISSKSFLLGKGTDPNEMHLHHLKRMLDCVPNGRGLTLHTTFEFLVTEGEKFRGWIERGAIGEVWNQIHSDWKNILGQMNLKGKLIGLVSRQEGEFQQQGAALQKHCKERIQKMETCAREPTLDDDPGEQINKHLRRGAPQGSTSPVR
jgi:hypothetical protein